MTWPPLEGIDAPCCRACGREPAAYFDVGLLIAREDGDLDLEPSFPMCDRCYRITHVGDEPPDPDTVDRMVTELRESQIDLMRASKGQLIYEPNKVPWESDLWKWWSTSTEAEKTQR